MKGLFNLKKLVYEVRDFDEGGKLTNKKFNSVAEAKKAAKKIRKESGRRAIVTGSTED